MPSNREPVRKGLEAVSPSGRLQCRFPRNGKDMIETAMVFMDALLRKPRGMVGQKHCRLPDGRHRAERAQGGCQLFALDLHRFMQRKTALWHGLRSRKSGGKYPAMPLCPGNGAGRSWRCLSTLPKKCGGRCTPLPESLNSLVGKNVQGKSIFSMDGVLQGTVS